MLHQDNIAYWVQAAQPYLTASAPHSLLETRPHFDVAIIGGGFTGLWLAYYLKKAQPQLSIALFEAKQIAYGASGRNGGWLSTNLPGVTAQLLKQPHINAEDIIRLQHHIGTTLSEVAQACQQEGIDCDLHQGGMLTIATNPAQKARLQQLYAHQLACGFTPETLSLLSATEARQRLNSPTVTAALYHHQGARIQPAKLAFGLKATIMGLGVSVFEHMPVTAFDARSVTLPQQTLSVDRVICCTEAYSDRLLHTRHVMPINSAIIATQVLPDAFWAEAGWQQRELLGDLAHVFMYAQRTADNRIILGGRGSPYRYNAQHAGHGHLHPHTVQMLSQRLQALFPWQDFHVEHAWCGSLGVTRNWCPTVQYDPHRGVGLIYGFAGHGVAATHLAARTMVDRILDQNSARTSLPWNDFVTPKWPIEPFRWLGIHALYKMLAYADKRERHSQQSTTPFLAHLAYTLGGMN
ncbi:MAG: FAD-dependent oxidoreductase [Neisseriaceae bacterium]|nr:FAD-dependent oxidoreductase [Neisseriaceae bacterium]